MVAGAEEGGGRERRAESSEVTYVCFREIRTQGCPCKMGGVGTPCSLQKLDWEGKKKETELEQHRGP